MFVFEASVWTDLAAGEGYPELYFSWDSNGTDENITFDLQNGAFVDLNLYIREGNLTDAKWSCEVDSGTTLDERFTEDMPETQTLNVIADSSALDDENSYEGGFPGVDRIGEVSKATLVQLPIAKQDEMENEDGPNSFSVSGVTCERRGDLSPVMSSPYRFSASPYFDVNLETINRDPLDDAFMFEAVRDFWFPSEWQVQSGSQHQGTSLAVENVDGLWGGQVTFQDPPIVALDLLEKDRLDREGFVAAAIVGAATGLGGDLVFRVLRWMWLHRPGTGKHRESRD